VFKNLSFELNGKCKYSLLKKNSFKSMICLGRKCCFQEISYAGNPELASSYILSNLWLQAPLNLPAELLQPQMELKGMLGKASSIYFNKISIFEWHNSLENVEMNWKPILKFIPNFNIIQTARNIFSKCSWLS
jgi:hypothetical protein